MYFVLVLFTFFHFVRSSLLGQNERVIFGFPSAPGCHKHVAVVTITVPGYGVYGLCTGSCINDKYVVTAAHCCDVNFVLYVTLGAQDLSLPSESSRQEFIANNQFINPNYTGTIGNYHYGDVCLLQLNTSAIFNNYVGSINLCPPVLDPLQEAYSYKTVTVSGYGGTSANAPSPSNKLNYYQNWIVPFSMASAVFQMYGSMNLNLSYHLTTMNGPASCFGDSGGSMVLQTYQNGDVYPCLLGLVTFGLATCGFASVCERLDTPNTQGWINSTILNNP